MDQLHLDIAAEPRRFPVIGAALWRRYHGRGPAAPVPGLLEAGELQDKFTRLTRGALGEAGAARLFARLQRLEHEANLDWLGAT